MNNRFLIIIILLVENSHGARKPGGWKKRFEEIENKIDLITGKLGEFVSNEEKFQHRLDRRMESLQTTVEGTLINFTIDVVKQLEVRENKNPPIEINSSDEMPADQPFIEHRNSTFKKTPASHSAQYDVIKVLKSLEKTLLQQHKKQMRRLTRLQNTLEKTMSDNMLMTAPAQMNEKEEQNCPEIEKIIHKMSDNLERDHKDIQQNVGLLQHQMSLDMGSGLRAMQLDILQCTRSVTELHRSLIGMHKQKSDKLIDINMMQQDEASLLMFNRHPKPIGIEDGYLQEMPVPSMQVVSAVLNGRPRSCAEIYHKGYQKSGIFSIWPVFNSSARLQVYTYCDMETEGGGWTVIQRRGNYGSPENFTRKWSVYKRGFGHVSREFWLGLDPIHALTHQDRVELRIEIVPWNDDKRYAKYNIFEIADEKDLYRLTVDNFTGDVEDCFNYHNGFAFSTIDSNNAGHISRRCAETQGEGGGWWYDNCYRVKLNSKYYTQGDVDRGQGIQWRCWKGYWYSMKHVEMKIRPHCFPDTCKTNEM